MTVQPAFILADFLLAYADWLESTYHLTVLSVSERPWLIAVGVGLLALPVLAFVHYDANREDRNELDDTEPRLKVVQIHPEARTYTEEDYRELVAAKARGIEAEEALKRINVRWDAEQRRLAAKRAEIARTRKETR